MRNNVKQIFFVEGDPSPYFEMENGEIKYPVSSVSIGSSVINTGWMTMEELEKERGFPIDPLIKENAVK